MPKAPTDALRALESTTAAVVAALMAAQGAGGGVGGLVSLPLSLPPPSSQTTVTLTLPPRSLTLSELQRLKRQFVTVHKKAITLGTTEKGAVDWAEEGVAAKFALYVEGHLKP